MTSIESLELRNIMRRRKDRNAKIRNAIGANIMIYVQRARYKEVVQDASRI